MKKIRKSLVLPILIMSMLLNTTVFAEELADDATIDNTVPEETITEDIITSSEPSNPSDLSDQAYLQSIDNYVSLTDTGNSQKEELENKIREILAPVQSDWSDEEKALYVHDWLVQNIKYNHAAANGEPSEYYGVYGALVKGTAVCSGYADSFELLTRILGMECERTHYSNHAWNIIKINGKWYYVDCTWDDPDGDNPDYIGHYCFMQSRDLTIRTHEDGLGETLDKFPYHDSATDYDNHWYRTSAQAITTYNSLRKAVYHINDTENKVYIYDYKTKINTDLDNITHITDQEQYTFESLFKIGNNIAIRSDKNHIWLIDINNITLLDEIEFNNDGTQTDNAGNPIYYRLGKLEYIGKGKIKIIPSINNQYNETYAQIIDWSQYYSEPEQYSPWSGTIDWKKYPWALDGIPGINANTETETITAEFGDYIATASYNKVIPYCKKKKEVLNTVNVRVSVVKKSGESTESCSNITLKKVTSTKPSKKKGIAKITIKLKYAKGATKEEKKAVKKLNKQLKKLEVTVLPEGYDLEKEN